MIDLNEELASGSWRELLAAATENAVTAFEIEFCGSLRQKLERFGARARLTDVRRHDKLALWRHEDLAPSMS